MTITAALLGLVMPYVLPRTWLADEAVTIAQQNPSAVVRLMIPEYLGGQLSGDVKPVTAGEFRFLAPSAIVGHRDYARATAATLMSYLDLVPNWDGEGAEAPTEETVWHALDMLEVIPAGIDAPKAMVLASGDVALYWDQGDAYAEIGFAQDGRYYAFATRPGHQPVHMDDVLVHDESGIAHFPTAVLDILTPTSQPLAA